MEQTRTAKFSQETITVIIALFLSIGTTLGILVPMINGVNSEVSSLSTRVGRVEGYLRINPPVSPSD